MNTEYYIKEEIDSRLAKHYTVRWDKSVSQLVRLMIRLILRPTRPISSIPAA